MPTTRKLHRLCQVRDRIRDSLHEEWTLEHLGVEAGMSSWHLLRTFRAEFGETPHAFLTRLRLERARQLLTVSSRSVTDVCFDVGFTSLGSFSSLFRRQVGLSPIEFRRNIRPWVTVHGHPPWVLVPFCFAAQFGGAGAPGGLPPNGA